MEHEVFTGKKYIERIQRHLGLLLFVDLDSNHAELDRSQTAIREMESDIRGVLVGRYLVDAAFQTPCAECAQSYRQ